MKDEEITTAEDLFRAAVEDVEPLRHNGTEPYRRRRPPHPLPQPVLEDEARADGLSEAEVETAEYLLFVRPGIQKRVVQELQRGHIPVDLELDLHGITVTFARDLLDQFLADCRRRRARCVLIIHGKGYGSDDQQPVLKRKVNYWLRLREEVLAFCSATRRQGGTGAVYALLRNPMKRTPRSAHR